MVRYSGFAGFVFAICIWIGCADSVKDNPFDPANQPFIVSVQAPVYDAQDHAIVLSWQYYGRAIQSYRLTRRNVRTNEVKVWEQTTPLPAASGLMDTDYDAQPVQRFVDSEAVLAGEEFVYEIEVEDAVAQTPGALGRIQVPGARLENVTLDLERAYAAIVWGETTGVEQAVQYEVVRQEGDGVPTVVFRTNDQTVTRYTDADVETNKRYKYSVRSTTQDGSVWESRVLERAFFLQLVDWEFSLDSGAYPYIESGEGAVYVFSAARTEGRLDQYGRLGVFAGNIGTILYARAIRPENFAFEILSKTEPPPIGSNVIQRTTNYHIASVVNSEVHLAAYSSSGIRPLSWTPEPWPVSPDVRVSLEIDGSNNVVYVIAGTRLRHYTFLLNKRGEIDLGLLSPVSDFALDASESLWVILPDERRVLKSPPAVVGRTQFQPFDWRDIVLPPQSNPHAITSASNQGRVFLILDAENRHILVYDSEGDLIFTVDDLDGLNFMRDGRFMGDIEVMDIGSFGTNTALFGERVYVLDAWGKVREFDTFFTGE